MRRKIILYNAKLKRQMRALKKLPALTSQPPYVGTAGGVLRAFSVINKT